MAIEWAKGYFNVWLHGTREQRIEEAKKNVNIVPYQRKGNINFGTYLCNICREDQSDEPYAVEYLEYSRKYFCKRCAAELGLAW